MGASTVGYGMGFGKGGSVGGSPAILVEPPLKGPALSAGLAFNNPFPDVTGPRRDLRRRLGPRYSHCLIRHPSGRPFRSMTERPAPTAPLHDAGIANLASIGIVLVVLGHSTPTSLDALTAPAVVAFRECLGLISLFHMPLFFFISGYLLVHSRSSKSESGLDGSYAAFVWGKAKRLLLPYWVISTAAFPVKAWMGAMAVRPLEFTIQGYLTSLWIPWQNTIIFFWFLPTLFLLFLVAPVFLKAVRHPSSVVVAATTGILILPAVLITPVFWNDPLNYRGAAAHAATFWLGMLWRERGPILTATGHAWLGGFSLLGFTMLGVAVYARVLPETPGASSWIHLAQAWTGVAATYGILRCLTQWGLERVPWIHGRSFQIYLLSWFPQMFVKLVLFRGLGIPFWPAVALMFLAGLLVPVAIVRWVERQCPRLKPCLGMSR